MSYPRKRVFAALRRRNRKDGFTTVELLVSLVVLAALAMAAVSSLSFGNRVWSRADSISTDTLETAELRTLRKMFGTVVAPQGTSSGGFSGSGTRVEFHSTAHFETGASEYSKVSVGSSGSYMKIDLLADHSGNKRNLVLKQIRLDRFSYFGKVQGDGTDGWQDSWSTDMPLPDLLRVDYVLEADQTSSSMFVVIPK